VGEWPVIQQATLSLWKSQGAMMHYAYHSAEHAEVVRRTRTENWYAEELFCRFKPLAESGTWHEQQLLAQTFGQKPRVLLP
jgi:hypothetical protein